MKYKVDLTIKRIREARHRISAKFEHDPKKVIEYYMELQKKYRDRILSDTEIEEANANVLARAT